MIKLKLAEVAKKMHKNISDVSRETGLNRNAVTALFHDKVDGVKFPTLEKICAVYNLKIEDLLELSDEPKDEKIKGDLYRQEGEAVPFSLLSPCIMLNKLDKNYFGKGFGSGAIHLKGTYGYFYWHKNEMNAMARMAYDRYKSKPQVDRLFREYEKTTTDIIDMYLFDIDGKDAGDFSEGNIRRLYGRIMPAFNKFWSMGLFIDSFDPGFDQEKIKEVADKHGITGEEVAILTTPTEMTFNNERVMALLMIARKLKRKISGAKKLDVFLDEEIRNNEEIRDYMKKFDYYKSNYSEAKHITAGELKTEIKKLLEDPKELEEKYAELKNYSANQEKKIRSILKKYRLKENPLYFFNKLTYWREHRKMIVLMGVHVLFFILRGIEEQTGISWKYLRYLSFNEVDNVLIGQISEKELRERLEKGVIFSLTDKGYKMLVGKEADSLKGEYDEIIKEGKDSSIISGHVASQGYARGIARIILDVKNFGRFKEGEILVTGMTRPEFLPVMKKAAAIVTNEGGITCHAAIVSRELGKPCIIGTQNATELIKDGDLIEVRANHGTVRILKTAKK